MDMCICGHSEREHGPTGECHVAGCRCKHFKPEIRGPRPPTRLPWASGSRPLPGPRPGRAPAVRADEGDEGHLLQLFACQSSAAGRVTRHPPARAPQSG